MDVILDSNVFFRTVISRGGILPLFRDPKLKLYAPIILQEEFSSHKEEIFLKSGLPKDAFEKFSSQLISRIGFVEDSEYFSSLPEAKNLLGTHLKDEDFVALALSKNCKVWTYEALLFKLGIGISTKQIADRLREEE